VVKPTGKWKKQNRSSLEIGPCGRFAGHPTKRQF